MILFYSGTGNSQYIAKKLSKELNDESLNLFERLKNKDYSQITSEKAYVVVCPTYGWQIPHILNDYLLKVQLHGSNKIYFVMTCGEDIGNASKYVSKLCDSIHMEYMGCAEIVMPENYIALFNVPEKDEAISIIHQAEAEVSSIISDMKTNRKLKDKKINFIDKFKSGMINKVFYQVIVKDRKFVVNDNCIACGICVKNCVMNNITLIDHKPEWNHNCTHCMACICGCPKEAIEYGKASVGKPRYQCPER